MDLNGIEQVHIESFEIIEPLGCGTYGAVYKAKQLGLDRLVALKVLKQTDAESLARFHREAQILAQLKHKNICQCFSFGVQKGVPFMALELIEAPTLRTIMGGEKMDWKESARIAIQVCNGLQIAHKLGIVHRDIKPENIMLLPDGTAKILDFGLSGFDSPGLQKLTQEHVTLGTPPYMSPEQCAAGQLDSRSDIYAMGCLLFECVAATPPFCGDTMFLMMMQHKSLPPPRLDDADSIPPGYEAIVRKALSKDPKRRYQSAEALGLALAELLADPAATVPLPDRGQRSGSRKFWPYVSAVAALILIAGIAWVFRPTANQPAFEESEVRSQDGSRQGLGMVSRIYETKTDASKQQARKLLHKIISDEEARVPPDEAVLYDAFTLAPRVFDPPAAEQCLQKAVALCRTHPEESKKLLDALWDLILVKQKQGKNAEALLLELSSSENYELYAMRASAILCREYARQGRADDAARYGIKACAYLAEREGAEERSLYALTIVSLMTLNSKEALEKSNKYLSLCSGQEKQWVWDGAVEEARVAKKCDVFLLSVEALGRLKQKIGASLNLAQCDGLEGTARNLSSQYPSQQEKISFALEKVLPDDQWMAWEMSRAADLVAHQDVAAADKVVEKCQRRFHQLKDWPYCYQIYLDRLQAAIMADSPSKLSTLLPLYDANLGSLRKTRGAESPEIALALWQRAHLNRQLNNVNEAVRDFDACEAIVVKKQVKSLNVPAIRKWKHTLMQGGTE